MLLTSLQSLFSRTSCRILPSELLNTDEVLAAVTEKLKLEHLDCVIADIEASWEHAILSEVEEDKEERAWEMMKSYARRGGGGKSSLWSFECKLLYMSKFCVSWFLWIITFHCLVPEELFLFSLCHCPFQMRTLDIQMPFILGGFPCSTSCSNIHSGSFLTGFRTLDI